MRHGSLFSGIGGFDLAAEWMGWENVFHCEWNEFGQKILKHHFPEADSYSDITKTDFRKYEGTVEIISGGFPCQPFSLAGKRKGTEDERYLWHEMLRAIQEIKPKFVLAENVYGIVNIDGGLVFEQVCLDLENEGYEVQPFVIPACAKDAPHRRDRVWFVAYRKDVRCDWTKETGRERQEHKQDERTKLRSSSNANGGERTSSNTDKELRERRNECDSKGRQNKRGGVEPLACNKQGETSSNTRGKGHQRASKSGEKDNLNGQGSELRETTSKCGEGMERARTSSNTKRERGLQVNRDGEPRLDNEETEESWWQSFPTQSPLCRRDDGLPERLDGITFPKWRRESIKAYGNAIVPQVAFEIFKALNENIS